MAKRSNNTQFTRTTSTHVTPRKSVKVDNHQPNDATRYKRLLYSLVSAVVVIGIISTSQPLIERLKSPKRLPLKIQESNIAPQKMVIPLAEDDPSLPKPYGYETVLSKRQVLISAEEVGGKVAVTPSITTINNNVVLDVNGLPPIVLASFDDTDLNNKSKATNETISKDVNAIKTAGNTVSNVENLKELVSKKQKVVTSSSDKINIGLSSTAAQALNVKVLPKNTQAKPISEAAFGIKTKVTFQAVSLSSPHAERDARALVAKIKQAKLNAYIESALNSQGVVVYRIKVGPFPRESAKNIRAQLESIGLKPFESYH